MRVVGQRHRPRIRGEKTRVKIDTEGGCRINWQPSIVCTSNARAAVVNDELRSEVLD